MQTKKCQVLVIGAGPGGYVAAIRSWTTRAVDNYC